MQIRIDNCYVAHMKHIQMCCHLTLLMIQVPFGPSEVMLVKKKKLPKLSTPNRCQHSCLERELRTLRPAKASAHHASSAVTILLNGIQSVHTNPSLNHKELCKN